VKRFFPVATALAVFLVVGAVRAEEPAQKRHAGKMIEAWLDDLRSPDLAVRQNAFQVMRTLGSNAGDVVPALIRLLGDPDETVGTAVSWGLASVGYDAITPLSEAMETGSPTVRLRAMMAFEKMRPKPAGVLPLLAKRVLDEEMGNRLAAIATIRSFGAAGILAAPELGKALFDSNREVRVAAATAICDLGPDASALIPELVRSLGDPDVRLLAVRTLGRIGPKSFPAIDRLVALLSDRDTHMLLEATSTLGKIGPAAKSAVPALEKVQRGAGSGNPYIDAAAREALFRISPQKYAKPKAEGN
jgi:HEAT repeat protein